MALGAGIWSGYVCPVMDARRAQVYNALFRVEQGVYQRLTEDRAISLEDLAQELASLEGPIFLVGDGSSLTFTTLSEKLPGLVLPPEWKQHQRALGVGLAAIKQIQAGASCDGAGLVPNYLRLSQAERERLERMNHNK
jgi:tRNA threonylcarbamoyladenosine biosynthesis protein TsaB